MNTEPELNPIQRLALMMLRFYALVVVGVGFLGLVAGSVLGWRLHELPWHVWLAWLPIR